MGALRFIARAKRLGLSLDESAELLTLLDEENCDPVQARMRELVSHRIDAANDQVADFVAFTAELQRVANRLATHTPDGPCDDTCGCASDAATTALPVLRPITLADRERARMSCSMEPADIGSQLSEWGLLLAQATRREAIPEGMRLHFDRSADVTAISHLAVAEQSCCSFFAFGIGISSDEITLEITGPPETQDFITSFAGA